MDIRIKSILIRNWKAIDELQIQFNGQNANIYGWNETGKTTIYDAFLWCLFGKDSAGQSTFEIKPIRNGEIQHNLESTVSVCLIVGDKEIEFTKMFHEVWTKKRGAEVAEFSGHEVQCWVNEEPVKITIYQQKVGSMIDESTFKIITNVDYFFGLKKPEMREKLTGLVGEVSYTDIAAGDNSLLGLVRLMQEKNLSVEAITKIAKQNISKYNGEIDGIQPRIDEVKRSMPAYQDWGAIRNQVADLIREKAEKTGKLAKATASGKAEKLNALNQRRQEKINQLTKAMQALLGESETELANLNGQISGWQSKIANITAEQSFIKTAAQYKAEIDELRVKYLEASKILSEKKALQFIPIEHGAEHCPTCGQTMPDTSIDEMNRKAKEQFDSEKATAVHQMLEVANGYAKQAQAVKANMDSSAMKIEALAGDIANAQAEIDKLNDEKKRRTSIRDSVLQQITDPAKGDPVIASLDAEIAELTAKVTDDSAKDALIAELNELDSKIDELNKTLAGADQITAANTRIAELQARNVELAKLVAGQEKLVNACERMSKLKSERLAESINSLFEYVQFRLFDTQINGAIVEDCTPMVGNVNLTTNGSRSQRIRAGLDVIKAFQKAIGTTAPVFIDNCESANWLLPMDCQTIKMFVSEDKSLRIEKEV